MKIIDKIFRDKKVNSVIYIILAVGILMLVFANSRGSSTSYPQAAAKTGEEISLKQETETILSRIDGVGEVDVMIACYSSDANTASLTSSPEPDIQSVLVVAEGGNNSGVRETIIRAVKAALGVEPHRIEVFERKEKRNDDGG